uniref:Zinc knuckle family protein n=1 Tax=Solanum tuberosum TaxID=4113 RepID=M1E0E3_SOLTU
MKIIETDASNIGYGGILSGNFGHITPNCKLEKLKTLELDEEIHDKVYSFLYTSGSVSDYESDSGSEEEIDLPDLSYNNQHVNMNACNNCHGDICSCENDEFYKLQSQFEDLNLNTITFGNFGHITPNCSEEDIDLPDLFDNNPHVNTNACNKCHGDICSCENDEFYKLQSQFEDLNLNTITFDNVIEL